jgi:quinol monooxygenase YgiN
MATQDHCVTIHPYFKVAEGKMGEFRQFCEQITERTSKEPRCLYYGFSFDGNDVFCREGYEGAEGLLFHLQQQGALIQGALKISELARVEVHGTEQELAKLRGPLAQMNPHYFVLDYGFRR